jgi:tetratricopeptide (TPR) repeat protein
MRLSYIIFSVLTVLAACEFRYSEHRMEPAIVIDDDYKEQWLAYLDEQINSSPRKSENHYRKALILSAIDDIEGALHLMRRAIVLNPENTKYRYLLARLLFQTGDYAAGLKEARMAESYGATMPGLDQVLGALYLQVGELKRAEEHLEKAIALDTLNHEAHFYRGMLFMARGDTLLAEEAIVRSVELHYTPAAIQALIDVAMYKKDYQKAFSNLELVLKKDSLNQRLLLQKSTLYQLTGKIDSATFIMHKLVGIDSLRFDYYQRLGQLHLIASRLDSATFYKNKVLVLDSNNTEALLTLARINDRRGSHNTAIDFYKRILGIDSTFQVARDELQTVNNRVAYLQRLRREREQQREIQLQEIQPRPVVKPQL